eukprot:g3568.t1
MASTQTSAWRLTSDGRMFRKHKYKYANGDIYDGEWVDGKRHGRGTMVYRDGSKYVGEYENGLFHGFGVMQWNTIKQGKLIFRGRKYEGDWKQGRKDGRGLYILGNGDSYEGDFVDDKYHGKGCYQYANGDVYDGDWVLGKWGGTGFIEFGNGDRYEGELRAGVFHGHGKYAWKRNGFPCGSYTGDYKSGMRHGRGRREYSSGNVYEGELTKDELCGEGTMQYANGDIYVGDWFRNQRHGNGVMKYACGDRYEGQWQNDVPYGLGKFTWMDGGYYHGEYLAVLDKYSHGVLFPHPTGKRHGKGIRVWSNGNRYEGDWVDDYMHGKGVYIFVEGGTYEGDFQYGKFHGYGKRIYGLKNGAPYVNPLGFIIKDRGKKGEKHCVYEGGFRDGLRDGSGRFISADGRIYEGQWKQDQRCGNGTMHLVPELEKGDASNGYTGGRDGLYRPYFYSGQWSMSLGRFAGIPNGMGRYGFCDGIVHEGTVKVGTLEGPGQIIYPGGRRRNAEFKRDTPPLLLEDSKLTDKSSPGNIIEFMQKQARQHRGGRKNRRKLGIINSPTESKKNRKNFITTAMHQELSIDNSTI